MPKETITTEDRLVTLIKEVCENHLSGFDPHPNWEEKIREAIRKETGND